MKGISVDKKEQFYCCEAAKYKSPGTCGPMRRAGFARLVANSAVLPNIASFQIPLEQVGAALRSKKRAGDAARAGALVSRWPFGHTQCRQADSCARLVQGVSPWSSQAQPPGARKNFRRLPR